MGRIDNKLVTTAYTKGIYNAAIKDKDLSLAAKGLYAQLVSLPATFKVSINGLTALSKTSRNGTISALKELESEGYIVRRHREKIDGQHQTDIYIVVSDPKNLIGQIAEVADRADDEFEDISNDDANLYFDTSRMYEKNFTLIHKAIFLDYDITLKAKGLYVLMCAQPEWADFTPEKAAHVQTAAGSDAIRRAMDELIEHKYVKKVRTPLANTVWKVDYELYPDPKKLTDMPGVEKKYAHGNILLTRSEYRNLQQEFGECDMPKVLKYANYLLDTLGARQLAEMMGIRGDSELVRYAGRMMV